jgi:hypothetical protein
MGRSLAAWTGRWRRLTPAERRALLESACLLATLDASLALLGMRRSLRLGERLARALPSRGAGLPPARIAELCELAARRAWPRSRCLGSALALRTMLRRRGFAPRLRIGARLDRGSLSAHAWVELAGEVLGEPETVRKRFRPLAGHREIEPWRGRRPA